MWTESDFGAPGHAFLCYKDENTEQPFVKMTVSPMDSKGIFNPQVGLSKPFSSASELEPEPELEQGLPNTITVQVDGYSIQVAAKAESKKIMDERVLEVTLDLKNSYKRV